MERRVGRSAARFGLGLVMVPVVLLAVFLIGMRTKSPAVVDRVRRVNRAFTNPRVLRSAGTAGASAAVIRHVGRTSGRPYETPVGPFEIGDDVVIAMPYGMRADWVRNVLAAGTAELVHQGRTLTITDPEVVPTREVLALLPAGEQRTLKLFGVDSCLRMHVADAGA